MPTRSVRREIAIVQRRVVQRAQRSFILPRVGKPPAVALGRKAISVLMSQPCATDSLSVSSAGLGTDLHLPLSPSFASRSFHPPCPSGTDIGPFKAMRPSDFCHAIPI
jgi:hypothetical protein